MMKNSARAGRAKVWIAVLLLLLAAANAAEAAPALKENARGAEVTALQKRLADLNYALREIDGIFGPETKRAVLLFQRDHKLKMTGVVDDKTWRALKKAKPAKKKTSAVARKKPAPAVVGGGSALTSKKQIPAIVATAKSYAGVPYQFGGTTPKGFDCSGFLQYVFAKNRVQIARSVDEQYKIGKSVKVSALEEGDLVFFATYEKGASHCGIYVGGGKFIHVSTKKGVRVDELKDAYWQPKYLGAKRLAQ